MMLAELSGKYGFEEIKKINKGWSQDEKYYITSATGTKYLLRLSDMSQYDRKKRQFELLQEVQKLGLNTPQPVEFGSYDQNRLFTLLTFLEGEDANDVLQRVDVKTQYSLGFDAGLILKKIHTLPASPDAMDWEERMNRKFTKKLSDLENLHIDLPFRDLLVAYVQVNRHLFKNRKQVFQHGDYHSGNMVVNDGKIGIIDFDRNDSGDPFEEFKCYCWNVYASPYFATGLIDGYFEGEVPSDFFPLLKLYSAEALLGHITWAQKFGEEEVKTAYKVLYDTIHWFDHFRLDRPTWYRKP
jgi:serine/threonine-protein kinase